jgi:hypothetical protein
MLWTLTKADLIEEVSGALKTTTKESAVIVQSILGSMVKALRTGEKIEIRGFGNFQSEGDSVGSDKIVEFGMRSGLDTSRFRAVRR